MYNKYLIHNQSLFSQNFGGFLYKLIVIIIALSVITACSTNNSEPAPANKSITAIPTPLQKLTAEDGELKAYVVIDGDENNRIEMTLNRTGAGAASVTIPNLSRSEHEFTITYEYTNATGTLVLATAGQSVNLTLGSAAIDIQADDYDLTSYDQDEDGVNNAQELLDGRDPFIVEVPMTVTTAIPLLSTSAIAAGTLRAFVTLDGNNENRLEMAINTETGIASYTFPALFKTPHDIIVTFEYTDVTSTIILSNASRTIDLTNGTATLDANVNNADFALFDEDNDGINNTNELLAGSNLRASILPVTPATASISYEQTKVFRFNWQDVPDATYYKLQERIDTGSNFEAISSQIFPATQTFKHIVPLYSRINAQYILQSCNLAGCIDGDLVFIDVEQFDKSVGYFKPDTISNGRFGETVSLSGNGRTLAVGDSGRLQGAGGAVYVFVQKNDDWTQQAVLEASNGGGERDFFGSKVELSHDGNTLIVSAILEDSNAVGVSALSSIDNSLSGSGAVYVFARNGDSWSEQAYLKASNTGAGDEFGSDISLSADGNTLVVGALREDGDSTAQNNDNAVDSGAAYVFSKTNTQWEQKAYLKAENVGAGDLFGLTVSISGNGIILAIGASFEDGANDLQTDEGVVYIFELIASSTTSNVSWVQQQYLKPDVIDVNDFFGSNVELNFNGNTLLVVSNGEDSNDPNDPFNNDGATAFLGDPGAGYIFIRNDTGWSQQAYLNASDSFGVKAFGPSVSMNNVGDTFVTGVFTGIALVYSLNEGQWVKRPNAFPITQQSFDNAFGVSVSISNDSSTIAIGASFETGSSTGINSPQNTIGENKGAVYLY